MCIPSTIQHYHVIQPWWLSPQKEPIFPGTPTELATSWPSGRGGARVAQLLASDPVYLPVGKTMP